MEDNNSEQSNKIANQLHEIDRSLSVLIGIGVVIAMSQVTSCVNLTFHGDLPVEVHITNIDEIHH